VNNMCLEDAERLAYEAYQGSNEYELGILQTLVAVQARAGRWEAADKYVRRYLQQTSVQDIVGGKWRTEILFFRDSVAAKREQWVADRIVAEAPSDDRWEVIRLALTEQSDIPEHLQTTVRIVSEQFRSDDPNPRFPTIDSISPR
jgi:hypothetical protein